MGKQALARILGILACAGFIWLGIGFAGFALFSALVPHLGTASAAALTAFVLLIVPAAMAALLGGKGPVSPSRTDSALSLIAALAKERPFLAILGAGLLGAAEVLFARRRKQTK